MWKGIADLFEKNPKDRDLGETLKQTTTAALMLKHADPNAFYALVAVGIAHVTDNYFKQDSVARSYALKVAEHFAEKSEYIGKK